MSGRAEIVIGVDPGAASGAIAVLNVNNLEEVQFFDLPSVKFITATGRRFRRIDRGLLLNLMRSLAGPNVVFLIIESQSGFGPIPGSTKFGLGNVAGLLTGMAMSLNLSVEEVKSQQWKKGLGLHRTEEMSVAEFKNLSRCKAIELFPTSREALRLKGSHNKAEALLIAEWGRRHLLHKYFSGYQSSDFADERSSFKPIATACEGKNLLERGFLSITE